MKRILASLHSADFAPCSARISPPDVSPPACEFRVSALAAVPPLELALVSRLVATTAALFAWLHAQTSGAASALNSSASPLAAPLMKLISMLVMTMSSAQ